MSKFNASETSSSSEDEIEAAMIEADLFVKYDVPHRALEVLRTLLARRPHSIRVRERLREIAAANKDAGEAARQCLALANLYILREEFDRAHERLLEAKQHDARISIASGLEAIRRAQRPAHYQATQTLAQPNIGERKRPLLAGDLTVVSIFDIVQVLENGRHTGTLIISVDSEAGGLPSFSNFGNTQSLSERFQVDFNGGQIVGASKLGANDASEAAFLSVLEVTTGTFEFEAAAETFPVTLTASSNTNLILDSLRQLDELRSKQSSKT